MVAIYQIQNVNKEAVQLAFRISAGRLSKETIKAITQPTHVNVLDLHACQRIIYIAVHQIILHFDLQKGKLPHFGICFKA